MQRVQSDTLEPSSDLVIGLPFDATLPASAGALRERLLDILATHGGEASLLDELLSALLEDDRLSLLPDEDRLTTRLFLEVLQDLARQGWAFSNSNGSLRAFPVGTPGSQVATDADRKRQIRASLVAARDEQLSEEAARRFVLEMERTRVHNGREVSVRSLFLSPSSLLDDLKRRLSAPPSIRDELLRDAVQPFLQPVTEERDAFTRLRLVDIWRYCRYTWSLPLSNQPGRSMLYLVRDGSRDFHPVIGIGALGNSVVQITCRDEEIGWTLRSLEQTSRQADRLAALERELEQAIHEIFTDDLVSAEELESPTSPVLEQLRAIANEAPRVSRSLVRQDSRGLMEDTVSPAYRRKRALELHRLLRAKWVLAKAAQATPGHEERLEALLTNPEGRRALGTALRSVKKRHIGSSMMDITTCGALPPYSHVLGGKLVALLMASPQVVHDYQRRYAHAPSEIASRMRGQPVFRPAELVLLVTTSLYASRSSQYNRLRAPVYRGELEFRFQGMTRGYGSVHLSQRTYNTVQALLRAHPGLEPESSTFAAGVNFKLRSISAALAHVGLTRLQQHETPRRVYLVPLAANWKDYLTGVAEAPNYIYRDVSNSSTETHSLIDFWKNRWFVPRVQRAATLRALENSEGRIKVSDDLRRSAEAKGRQGVPPRQEREHLKSNGDTAMASESVIPWGVVAELKDRRASFAERLAPDELLALHVPTKLDHHLVDLVSQGHRVYLAGNPGDGKTHIIRRFLSELESTGTFISLDASADDEASLITHLSEAIESDRPAIVAINEGPLRRILSDLPARERDTLRDQLDRPYLYGSESSPECSALLVNLQLRQALVREIAEPALATILNKVDYSNAPEAVVANMTALSAPLAQERLLSLLDLVAKSGAHVTMHELFGFLAFMITGGQPNAERASRIGPYFELCFSEDSPLARWLRSIDPGFTVHPIIDMKLWDGGITGQSQWVEESDSVTPERCTDPEVANRLFRSLKRQYFFETPEGERLLALLPDDRKTFYDLLSLSDGARDAAKARILRAIGHFYGDASADSNEGLHIPRILVT